jgi:hypothetical protein
MTMKAAISLAIATLAAAGVACASTPRPAPVAPVAADGSHFLRGRECLEPSMARSWTDLDNDTVLVDAGRYRYRIQVAGACSALRWTQVLAFRGDPVGGRVCGGVGDAILTRDYPCAIRGMQLLDKDEYKALLQQRADARKRKRAAAR